MVPGASESHELQRTIEELHTRYKPLTEGQVATYIPELTKANPEDFGICLVTAEGRVFEAGDCDRPFTIQSISKPFTFGMALEAFGAERVAQHVGVEPSGDAFNSIELQNGTNRPYNPMVNSGAITVTALLHKHYGDETFDRPRSLQPRRRPPARRSMRPSTSPSAAPVIATGRSRTCCSTSASCTTTPSPRSTSTSGSARSWSRAATWR